jgi:hypothetical protein
MSCRSCLAIGEFVSSRALIGVLGWRLIVQLLDALTKIGLCDANSSPLKERVEQLDGGNANVWIKHVNVTRDHERSLHRPITL